MDHYLARHPEIVEREFHWPTTRHSLDVVPAFDYDPRYEFIARGTGRDFPGLECQFR